MWEVLSRPGSAARLGRHQRSKISHQLTQLGFGNASGCLFDAEPFPPPLMLLRPCVEFAGDFERKDFNDAILARVIRQPLVVAISADALAADLSCDASFLQRFPRRCLAR